MTFGEFILIAIIISFLIDNWDKLKSIGEKEEEWEEKHNFYKISYNK